MNKLETLAETTEQKIMITQRQSQLLYEHPCVVIFFELSKPNQF